MANNPVFVADLATLKARLRLSGVPVAATDTLGIIDDAVLRARMRFYRRLGASRVADLVAIAYVEDPTTDDGILRALANSVEVNIVRFELMQTLPTTFMDASGDANKKWNEEALFRERGPTERQKELTRLEDQIEEDMQMLALEEELAAESGIQTYDGTPTIAPPRPGDSIRITRRTHFVTED